MEEALRRAIEKLEEKIQDRNELIQETEGLIAHEERWNNCSSYMFRLIRDVRKYKKRNACQEYALKKLKKLRE